MVEPSAFIGIVMNLVRTPLGKIRSHWRWRRVVGLDVSGEYGAIWDPKTWTPYDPKAYWFYRIVMKNIDSDAVAVDLVVTKRFDVGKGSGDSLEKEKYLDEVEALGRNALRKHWDDLRLPEPERGFTRERVTMSFEKWGPRDVDGRNRAFRRDFGPDAHGV